MKINNKQDNRIGYPPTFGTTQKETKGKQNDSVLFNSNSNSSGRVCYYYSCLPHCLKLSSSTCLTAVSSAPRSRTTQTGIATAYIYMSCYSGTHPRLYQANAKANYGLSYGLTLALAARGVIVQDRVFPNFNSSELRQKGGATIAESVSGLPVHVRETVIGEGSEISKAQFNKLLKQVTSHLSSISNLFVHDGAIGSSSKCSPKVRVTSDSPSAVLSLSKFLWSASARAVSHDTCHITIYVVSSISETIGSTVGIGSPGNRGIIAADTERSSLILCGDAFSDANGVKQSLALLSEPIISARGGIPLSAWLLELGDSVILLFAPEDVSKSCLDQLVSPDAGVVLTSQGVAPFFQARNPNAPSLYNLPAALILVASDSSGVLPAVSKLNPGQAAYHFLAGYQNGKFLPAFNTGPSCIDPLDLSKALLTKFIKILKDIGIVPFLVNINDTEEHITGKDLVKVVEAAVHDQKNISSFRCEGGDLRAKLKRFLSSKYSESPEEFSY